MLRILFVCPHFAPTNAPDGHRVRLLLPHFQHAGIEADVLSVDPSASHFSQDAWLLGSLPEKIRIHRANAHSKSWGCIPGFGSLSFRAMSGLKKLGDEILGKETFDLIYFSTTQFGTHLLGPYWKEKHGVPFVMDFQDPWVNDYYRDHPDQMPPGGKIKFAAADRFNRNSEPKVLAHCSGITSVSPAYPEALAKRYAHSQIIDQSIFSSALIAPFPAEKAELDRVTAGDVEQSIFDRNDGKRHWVYTGRCGAFMEKSVRSIFRAIELVTCKHPDTAEDLRLHFIGTSYSSGVDDSPISKAASEFGLEKMVNEIPDRIPLSESLRALLDADALLVPGSDDPGYNASKIYPYLLAEKPLLAVFHQESPITKLIADLGGGLSVPFSDKDSIEIIARRIGVKAFPDGLKIPSHPIDKSRFAPHTAESQASELADFFRSILGKMSSTVRHAA